MIIKPAWHAIDSINDCLAWCPKRRRAELGNETATLLKALIHDKATAPKGEGHDLTVQPDRGHLLCNFMPTITPYQIMYRLKQETAHVSRAHDSPEELLWLTSRLPNLWRRSYYVGAAGPVSAETGQRHIAKQTGE